MKRLNRNPEIALFFTGLCVCLAFSANNLKANWNAIASVQSSVRESSAAQMRLQASQQAAQAQAEIAEERYKKGCLFVVAMNSPGDYTSLSESEPVIDRIRKKPLPKGTLVCDANGNTAILETNAEDVPVVAELAFTGSREIIDAARARNKSKARYAQPNQE